MHSSRQVRATPDSSWSLRSRCFRAARRRVSDRIESIHGIFALDMQFSGPAVSRMIYCQISTGRFAIYRDWGRALYNVLVLREHSEEEGDIP